MAVVDLHSHLMPGVDDGARDAAGARETLDVLAAAGVTSLAATPHLRASVLEDPGAASERLGELDAAWPTLTQVAAEQDPWPDAPSPTRWGCACGSDVRRCRRLTPR